MHIASTSMSYTTASSVPLMAIRATLLWQWWRETLVMNKALRNAPKFHLLWGRGGGKSGIQFSSVQFSSVAQSCPTLCEPMNCSTPGLPVHHQLSEFTQTYVHWGDDAIQPSHLLSSPSPPAVNLSQHQGLFKWVSSSHQVAKVLEFQLQYQSFQWIFRDDVL